MSDKGAVTLAEELERAFPAGGTIGARLSDHMFRRILAALRQAATERADTGGGEAPVRMSACDRCGAQYPTAPRGHIHKCGRCSGGYCHPVKPTEPASEVEDRIAKAELSRTVYACALEKMRIALLNVRDGLEDEGDRVYLGSTNHADLLHNAWETADALNWDEVLADTQPDHPLAETNLHLQSELTRLQAENARLRKALIEAGREAGAILSDTVSNDFLMLVPGEVKAKIATLGGSDA